MSNVIASSVVQTLRSAVTDCIPINDLFTSALQDPFNLLIGGVGGVVTKFVITIVLVVLLIRILVNVVRARRAGEDISSIATVIGAVILIILAVIIFRTVFAALNGYCGTL